MKRLGRLPLLYQPGEQWLYHTPADALGVLMARASGQPLGDVLPERLFAPLGMSDTGFSVPAAKLDRLAAAYRPERRLAAAHRRPPAVALGPAARLPLRAAAGWSPPPMTCWPSAR